MRACMGNSAAGGIAGNLVLVLPKQRSLYRPALLIPSFCQPTLRCCYCCVHQVLANGVLLIDKPPRWSSADVMRQLKNVLKVKKIGVGGPLDAQATGLLIVLFGEFAVCFESKLVRAWGVGP